MGQAKVLGGLVLTVLAGLAVVGLEMVRPDEMFKDAAQVAELATYPVMLAAAALLYVYFRLTPEGGTAWLAAVAVFGTTQGAGYAALRIAMEDQVKQNPGWLMATQVVVAAVLLGLLAAQRVLRDVVDPLLVGLGLGVVVTIWRLALVGRVEPSAGLERAVPALAVLLVVLYSAIGMQLVRIIRLPRWAPVRLAGAMGVLGLVQVLTYPVAHDDLRSIVAVGLSVLGNALLAATSVRLVREAMARQQRSQDHLDVLEANLRRHRTLIHEVAGSVAGISAASKLLSIPEGLPLSDRFRLQELLDAEAARVARLVSATRDQRLVDVGLDLLVSSVVLAHSIRGRDVSWHPTGDRVRAREDDLVEVLTLLLDNAALHSGATSCRVVVRRLGQEVELAVGDDGRGIAPELASSITEWGARGPGSPGQGIGLAEAERLVVGMGGRLSVTSGLGAGTRVSVVLPAAGDREVLGDPSAA
jgi:signal transduction histidine kinase